MVFGKRTVQSKKARKEKKRAFFEVTLLASGLCIAVIILLTQLTRLPQASIDTVEVNGVKTISEREVTDTIETALKGAHFGFLFPKRSAFLIPRHELVSTLLLAHPRLEEIHFNVEELSHLIVRVTERRPVAVWCESEVSTNCLFVDSNGFAYAPAPQFTGSTFFKMVGDPKEGVVAVGIYVLPTDDFQKLYAFVAELRGLNLNPVTVLIDADDFTVALEEGGSIRFLYADNYSEHFSNVRDILSANVLQTKKGDRRLDIDYIDMRFGNKVYFKVLEEGGEREPIGSETETITELE